jgi:hypothetical protein
VLAFAGLQYGFHLINHIVDIGESDPGWLGPGAVVSLTLLGALIVYLWRRAGEEVLR